MTDLESRILRVVTASPIPVSIRWIEIHTLATYLTSDDLAAAPDRFEIVSVVLEMKGRGVVLDGGCGRYMRKGVG